MEGCTNVFAHTAIGSHGRSALEESCLAWLCVTKPQVLSQDGGPSLPPALRGAQSWSPQGPIRGQSSVSLRHRCYVKVIVSSGWSLYQEVPTQNGRSVHWEYSTLKDLELRSNFHVQSQHVSP